jgi:hypothetical protein
LNLGSTWDNGKWRGKTTRASNRLGNFYRGQMQMFGVVRFRLRAGPGEREIPHFA